MIRIGLTTWTEHPSLLLKNKPTLQDYASKLPLIEIDSPFYGIPRRESVANWVQSTPSDFKFIVKSHQGMTLHRHWADFYATEKELYQTYFEALEPLRASGKLAAILCQFPASFDCVTEHVTYLKRLRKIFKGWPLAIELRHGSWYTSEFLTKTLSFMREHEYTLLTIDEPQVVGKSVPFYPDVTTPTQAIFRFHGRSTTAWQARGENWRKERTLYRYNEIELEELASTIKQVSKNVKETYVIFNNNSGGDAAANALSLIELLGIEYTDLNPSQLALF